MDARAFTMANLGGGVVWAAGVSIAGYFLGKSIPNVDHYLLPIIGLIIVISLVPIALEVKKARGKRRRPVA